MNVSARSLMRIQNRETDLIVVDEGTSSLDPVAESTIIDYLNSIRQDKTMVFVTHRPGSFAQKADRIMSVILLSTFLSISS
jgi:ABC-type bacteriocin/lantibiotic exporter with double-glycine peptidase domain